VTGRGHIDLNRISGYLPGKIVFFLMQVGPVGAARAILANRRVCKCHHVQPASLRACSTSTLAW